MARDVSGTYSLADPETPLIANTTASADDMNTIFDDIEAALTDSLSRNGYGGMSAPIILQSGSVGAPAVAFSGETNTGMYKSAAATLGFGTGGVNRALLDATKLQISAVLYTGNGAVSGPAHSFTAETASGLYRAGAGDIRMAIGGADVVTYTATALTIAAALTAAGITSSKGLTVTQSTTNGVGAAVTGNGSGTGLTVAGGATGAGLTVNAGASGNGVGALIISAGSGTGADIQAGGSGYGCTIAGSSTRSPLRLIPQSAPSGPNAVGDLYSDASGILYICTSAGTPGTFTKVGTQT